MLNFLYFFSTPWATANKAQLFLNRVLGVLANILYPLYAKITRPKYLGQDSIGKKTIVSFTTYPGRISVVDKTIHSIFRQSVMPEKVILWLADSQFPSHSLPNSIKRYLKYGLEIRYCDDIRSYKKIFYTAQEFSGYKIVTIDDDTLYPENWLQELLSTANRYPKLVCCYRAHKMKVSNGKIDKYNKWIGLSPDEKGPSAFLVPIGVGGVLYPEGYFSNIEFDKKTIMNLSPISDDLWLKVIGITKSIPAVKVNVNSKEWFTLKGSQKSSLMSTNVGESENDLAMKRLLDYYMIDISTIQDT